MRWPQIFLVLQEMWGDQAEWDERGPAEDQEETRGGMNGKTLRNINPSESTPSSCCCCRGAVRGAENNTDSVRHRDAQLPTNQLITKVTLVFAFFHTLQHGWRHVSFALNADGFPVSVTSAAVCNSSCLPTWCSDTDVEAKRLCLRCSPRFFVLDQRSAPFYNRLSARTFCLT